MKIPVLELINFNWTNEYGMSLGTRLGPIHFKYVINE